MKKLQTVVWVLTSLTLFTACQSTSAQDTELANKETRNRSMNTIASDSKMSKEMTGKMMNTKSGMMMQQNQIKMMGNQSSMMNMFKTNPGILQGMFSAMMDSAKDDGNFRTRMLEMMKADPLIMEMMQNMTANNNMIKDMHQMNRKDN